MAWQKTVALSHARRMLDVAGGSGAFTITLCQRHPQLRATIVDFPAVIEVAQRFVREAWLQGPRRLHQRECAHRAVAPVSRRCSHVVSPEWRRGQRDEAVVRPGLSRPGTGWPLVIHDFMVDDDRAGPRNAALWFMTFLFDPEAVSFTPSELVALVEGAGFVDATVRDLIPGLTRLLIARKPGDLNRETSTPGARRRWKPVGSRRRGNGFASTQRVDAWWIGPAWTAFGLVLFFGYLTFRAFNATSCGPIRTSARQSPRRCSRRRPAIRAPCRWTMRGSAPSRLVAGVPAAVAGVVPAGLAIAFRFTCYYYRGAYYKAFVLTPPSCAVRGLPGTVPRGDGAAAVSESSPLHPVRRAVAARVPLVGRLAAFFRDGQFGIGVGTVVMLMNAALLTG